MKHSLLTTPLTSNSMFGRYRLLERLGVGGMAEVFLCEMQGLSGFSKMVAIKVMHPHLMEDDKFGPLFISEARLGGFLSHPNIVETLDFGQIDDRLFLVMEYVDGPTLQRLLTYYKARARAIPTGIVLRILIQMCSGLHHAHEAKDRSGQPLHMVHRDLKPSNILIARHGQVKIADFGVARASSNLARTNPSGSFKGTLQYMSPEQAEGDPSIDHRSDIFALGLIMYELLSLERLYSGESVTTMLRRVLAADVRPKPEHLPEGPLRGPLMNVITTALARWPADRFPSCKEMESTLEALSRKADDRTSLRSWIESQCPELFRPEQASGAIAEVSSSSPASTESTVPMRNIALDTESVLTVAPAKGRAKSSDFSTDSLREGGVSAPPRESSQSALEMDRLSSDADVVEAVEHSSPGSAVEVTETAELGKNHVAGRKPVAEPSAGRDPVSGSAPPRPPSSDSDILSGASVCAGAEKTSLRRSLRNRLREAESLATSSGLLSSGVPGIREKMPGGGGRPPGSFQLSPSPVELPSFLEGDYPPPEAKSDHGYPPPDTLLENAYPAPGTISEQAYLAPGAISEQDFPALQALDEPPSAATLAAWRAPEGTKGVLSEGHHQTRGLLRNILIVILVVSAVGLFLERNWHDVRTLVFGPGSKLALVSVRSIPPGATISTAGGTVAGQTPLQQPLEVQSDNTISLLAAKDGYHTLGPIRKEVSPGGEVAFELVLQPLEALLGSARIVTEPPGARVVVDGMARGVAPVEVQELHSSEMHMLEIFLSGYQPLSKTFRVTAGDVDELDLVLLPEGASTEAGPPRK